MDSACIDARLKLSLYSVQFEFGRGAYLEVKKAKSLNDGFTGKKESLNWLMMILTVL